MLKIAFILLFTAAICVCQFASAALTKDNSLITCVIFARQQLKKEELSKPELANRTYNSMICPKVIANFAEDKSPPDHISFIWTGLNCPMHLMKYSAHDFQVKEAFRPCKKDDTTCERDYIDKCLYYLQDSIENPRPRSCDLPAHCGGATPYCLNGKCVAASDEACVAEGHEYTGGLSCCYPMVNPKEKGLPCRILDTEDCSRDVECGTRSSNNQFVCCTNHRGGKGSCWNKSFLPSDCEHEAFGKGTAYEPGKDY